MLHTVSIAPFQRGLHGTAVSVSQSVSQSVRERERERESHLHGTAVAQSLAVVALLRCLPSVISRLRAPLFRTRTCQICMRK